MINNLRTRFVSRFLKGEIIKRFLQILSIDVLTKISGIILLPIYLRLMSQDEYGLFSYITSLITTASGVLIFGLYISQSKIFTDYDDVEKRGKLLYSINLFILVSHILIIVPCMIFGFDRVIISFLFKNAFNYDSYRYPMVLGIYLVNLGFMFFNFLLITDEIKKIQQYNIARLLLLNLATLVALYFIPGDKAAIRFICFITVELIVISWFIKHYVKHMVFQFDYHLLKKALILGFPIMLNGIFGLAVNFSDKFFLEKYATFAQLSVYYLAFSIANIITFALASFQNIYFPMFLKEKNIRENVRKTKKLIKGVVLFFLSVSVMLELGSILLFKLGIIPIKYFEVVYVLPLIMLLQMVIALTSFFGYYLVYFDKTFFLIYVGFAIGVMSILTNLYFVPRFMMYGAIISSLIINTLYLSIYAFIARKYINENLKLTEPVYESNGV